ncbi:unnamed protein product [Closterium sp. Yama58-4]|nr:unnamed protein product [Closterium sp. Yama58-4]
MSQVDPPPLLGHLEVSSDTSGPAEGGDPAADDTVAARHSPRLETRPGFPPRPSSPPLQPVAVDFGATGGGDTGGVDSGGVGSGGAGSRGAQSGGAGSGGDERPSGGGVFDSPTGVSPSVLPPLQRRPLHRQQRRLAPPVPASESDGAGGAGTGGTCAGSAGNGSSGAGGTGAGGARAGGAGAGDSGAGGTGAGGSIAGVTGTGVCRLDYVATLVTESESDFLPFVVSECALGTNVLEDRQFELECLAAAVPHLAAMLLAPEGDPDALDIPTPRSYTEAISGPYSSQWQTAIDTEMASWKSTSTYVDAIPPPGANIVDGMWIFRVKRPPGSPPTFKVHYVARGLSQQQGVDYFHTFSSTPKMTTLWVLLHVAAQRDYELHSLDFSTAFLQGSLYKEIWLRLPPGFPEGTQWSLRRPVYGLRQAPREWHDILRTTLAALAFAPSIADPSLFLRTDTSLPPFYILVYVDDLVFATADTKALALVKSELQKRHTCTDLGKLRSYLDL